MTPDQKAALQTFADHGGDGVITRRGTLLAAGVELGQYVGDELHSAYHSVTWLRLVAAGLIEGAGGARLKLTATGKAVVS